MFMAKAGLMVLKSLVLGNEKNSINIRIGQPHTQNKKKILGVNFTLPAIATMVLLQRYTKKFQSKRF